MPEIIKLGQRPEDRAVGMAITCHHCATQFRIAAGDHFSIRRGGPQQHTAVIIGCPVCGFYNERRLASRKDGSR